MEQTTLEVEGMSCDGCERNVIESVEALEGVSAVTADRESGEVRVEHERERFDRTAIDDAVENAGYDVVG